MGQEQGTRAVSAPQAGMFVYGLTANGSVITDEKTQKKCVFSTLDKAKSKLRDLAGNAKAEIKVTPQGLRINGLERLAIKTWELL